MTSRALKFTWRATGELQHPARAGVAGLVLMLIAAACTFGDEGGQRTQTYDTADAAEVLASDQETTTTTEPCQPEANPLELDDAPEASAQGLISLSAAVYQCQTTAVVVGSSDRATARFAAELATAEALPLLLVSGPSDEQSVLAELERLQVDRVTAIEVDTAVFDGLDLTIDTPEVPVPTTIPPTTSAPSTTGATSTPTTTADAPTTEPPSTTTTTEAATDTTTPESATAQASSTTAAPFDSVIPPDASADGPVVILRPGEEAAAHLLTPAVAAGGGTVAVKDPADIDGMRSVINGRTAFLSGELTPTEQWQINLASSDTELFGGGTQVFPDRRIIAYYGNPLTFRLGILGETNPERAVERVSERAELYNAPGLPPALPGFEIIVTVASTKAGDDGDYSNEMDIEVVRPWIDAAMANDVSVILDLQPGRTDFVTQAKLYEEFLRLPNVGLALDPEWRLEPDQRHLRQIGSVDAAEINAVIDYLTGLVHEENLPQKVLILHQFNTRMLPDRELVKTPPEIAVVVHVDGQGSLGSKYGTWNAMLEAPTDPQQNLWWAWKNFIDEDFPTATPGQVNDVQPLPVIVTYQ